MAESKRNRFQILRTQLDNERSSFIPYYRDLADYILPTRQRFTITDANRGNRRNQKIIDSTGTNAASILASGMMSGITSPARPWFRLASPDPDLNEYGAVKDWLTLVSDRMRSIFLRSNLYNILPTQYKDLGVFGTAPISIEEDFNRVIRAQSFPVGSYYLAKDNIGKINVFFREFRMTVRQLVQQFGQFNGMGKPDWSNISTHVKNLYDRGAYEEWVDICYVISPNEDYQPTSQIAKYKKFSACYYERGFVGSSSSSYMAGYDDSKILEESGFDYFPILCPRWSVTGEDVYSTDCPGMASLGDIKQLQKGESMTTEAIEKLIRPPMIGPTSMMNQPSTILPAGITYADTRDGQQGFRPAFQVDFRIQEMEMKQQQLRNRINQTFYADLFRMLSQIEDRQRTATEIDERKEEKLLALGPVLEQLNQDQLNPLVDITFDIMVKQGMIPPAPQELQGMPLKVEYVSIMAQAQKMIGLGAKERFMNSALTIGQQRPEIWDKIDVHQYVDQYGDDLGIENHIIRTDEDVAKIEEQRAQAQAQQNKMAQMEQASMTAKNLAQSDMSGDNALKALTDQARAGQLT